MRLRITTTLGMRPSPSGPVNDLITSGHVRVELDCPGPRHGEQLEGVQSVTWHCGGRDEPAVAVLVIRGVSIDALVDLPPEAEAALQLIEGRK